MTRVVFLLTPGLHLLDLAGPAQVFGAAADVGHEYELRYVAGRADVRTHQGLTVVAETEPPRVTTGDLLVVPGWRSPLRSGEFPDRYQQSLRLERAEHLIGHGSTVEAAARAVGFGDARMLRRLRNR
ncbi:hypothetical protein [Actinoplanes sp. NPDC089786]|uniref:hypothetical protein n=1 Tax=Actinoplanes sp. NPDC089786 TaxID=3155185 RepID=UPI0034499352